MISIPSYFSYATFTRDKEVKGSLEKDPICGMAVDEKTAKYKSDYKGKTYYFCSQYCQTKFDKDPSKFASK
jgi:Cu+-exporting ATPase